MIIFVDERQHTNIPQSAQFLEFEFAISRELRKFDRPSHRLQTFDDNYKHMSKWQECSF